MNFRFAYPEILSLFVLVFAWLLFIRYRKPASITYSITHSLSNIASGYGDLNIAMIPVMLRTACLSLLIIAAARPQLYSVEKDVRSPGVDIMLLIDTSGSMQALDFRLNNRPVTRLAAIKKVVRDFIKKRKTDRIGLVVFGKEAFTQCPLTMDKGLLLELIKRMKVGMAGDSTAIGSAIAVGAKRLKDIKAKSKIMILLTDGRNNAGEITPEQAAEAAHALGIKIYTIGVGKKGPVPFKVRTLFGIRTIYQRVDLDDAALKRIAKIGGGKYFSAANTKELSKVYDMIDKEQKTEVKIKEFFHFHELYHFFLIPALVLFCIEVILRSTLLRIIP